jgi:methyltransferase-like protein
MKTLDSYDVIPYESFAIPETHPDFLASLGCLLGLSVPDPEHCRVLELGAASGGNLIPMAFHLPWSEFVGVELSAEQARRGQAMIAELGLSNVHLLHQDILQVDETSGPFDFILVHGVYSWVPEAVKEHILHLCGRLLCERGIAYISYNILPGWRQRGMLRDMLLFHCRLATAPGERLSLARELLDRLDKGLENDRRPEARTLRSEVEYLRKARASYLYHEYLEETNSPELFSDFMSRARRHGLEYLAESKLHTMFASTLGPAAEQALEGLGDQVAQEQYMDFLRLRAFRQTLLVRAEVRPSLNIDLEQLFSFSFYADLQPLERIRLNRIKRQDYAAPDGARLHLEHPLTKALVACLAETYPNAMPLDALLKAAAREVTEGGGGRFAADRDACLGELFNLYVSQGVGLTRRTARWPNQVVARPEATPLARAQAASGEGHVAGVRHSSLGLDALAAWVLMRLDGSRDRDILLADLIAEIRINPALAKALGPATDSRPVDRIAPASLDQLLGVFARAGLLAASAEGAESAAGSAREPAGEASGEIGEEPDGARGEAGG